MSLKVLHTGDGHIDSNTHGTTNSETGISTAWESHQRAVASSVQAAIDNQADVFIDAGDAFDTGMPSQEAILMYADTLMPLMKAGIPYVGLGGNHERIRVRPSQRTATLTLGAILSPHGEVHIAERDPELIRLKNGLQVAALPWLSKSTILSQLGETRLDPVEGDRRIVQFALDALERICDEADDTSPFIMASHVTVDDVRMDSIAKGHKRGSETDIAHVFSEPILPRKALEDSPISYAALSHIHARQRMGQKCFYAGSPDRLTLTDADDPKSVNLVSIGDNNTLDSVDFIETDARKMHSINLTDADAEERLDALDQGALVGLILAPGEGQVPASVLEQITDLGARVIDTQKTALDRPRNAAITLPEKINPVEALGTWLSEKRPNANANLATSLAAGLLEEEGDAK